MKAKQVSWFYFLWNLYGVSASLSACCCCKLSDASVFHWCSPSHTWSSTRLHPTGKIILVILPCEDSCYWHSQGPKTHCPVAPQLPLKKACMEQSKDPIMAQVLASGGITHVYRFKYRTWKGSSTHHSAIQALVLGWGLNKALSAEAFWQSCFRLNIQDLGLWLYRWWWSYFLKLGKQLKKKRLFSYLCIYLDCEVSGVVLLPVICETGMSCFL